MKIKERKENETLTLELEGRLDTTTAPDLEKAIKGVTEESKNLILDMNKLEYVSSAGLRVLLAAQKQMTKVGSMKLVGVADSIMEVFEITGFADILEIE